VPFDRVHDPAGGRQIAEALITIAFPRTKHRHPGKRDASSRVNQALGADVEVRAWMSCGRPSLTFLVRRRCRARFSLRRPRRSQWRRQARGEFDGFHEKFCADSGPANSAVPRSCTHPAHDDLLSTQAFSARRMASLEATGHVLGQAAQAHVVGLPRPGGRAHPPAKLGRETNDTGPRVFQLARQLAGPVSRCWCP